MPVITDATLAIAGKMNAKIMLALAKRKYRYRDPQGSTRFSLDAMSKHLAKVGKLIDIKGYVSDAKGYKRVFVMVRGEYGSARFMGFSWGYSGEGPRGLKQLLDVAEVSEEFQKLILATSWEPDRIHSGSVLPKGVNWLFNFEQKTVWIETQYHSATHKIG